MPSCPAGHDSSTTDYCDVCGTPMAARSAPPPAGRVETCASCGGSRSGRFCEECGHDSMTPVPEVTSFLPSVSPPAFREPDPAPAVGPGPVAWSATVRADRAWFEELLSQRGPDAAAVMFPLYCPERRFDLTGAQLVVGRRNRARGVDPEIDLSGPPLDPGISTLHALLTPNPDGGWAVVDLGSTNGTVVGPGLDPIPPNTPVALSPGDRIKIGAWTTITVDGG
jgi:hypothetical protein